MRKLAKIAAPVLAAVAALGAVLPAQAATRHGDGYGYGYGSSHGSAWGHGRDDYRSTPGQVFYYRDQINDLSRMIDRRGGISNREERGLRSELRDLRFTFDRFAHNGLSRREVSELQDRIAQLRHRIYRESRDRDYRRW